MRELLEAVADGSLSPAQAEAELNGYVTGEAGRFDAARQQRRGIPEAILAEGKSVAQVSNSLQPHSRRRIEHSLHVLRTSRLTPSSPTRSQRQRRSSVVEPRF